MKPKISIIINTYRGKKFLPDFFAGLEGQTLKDFEIIVVDNNTIPEEVVDISDYKIQKPVNFIKIDKNIGYGPTLNYGITEAFGKYIFALNTDIVFSDNTLLEKLFHFMEWHEEYGLISPQVFERGKGIYKIEGDFREITHVKGCCMLFRKSVIDDIGAFDPDFVIYAEEDEFCYRLRKNNYRIGFLGTCSLTHLGSGVMNLLTDKERISSMKSYVCSNNMLRMKEYSIPKVALWTITQLFFSIPAQLIFWMAGLGDIARKLEDKGPHPEKKYRANITAFALILNRSVSLSKIRTAFYWLSAKYKSLFKMPVILTRRKKVKLNIKSRRYLSLIDRQEKYNYVQPGED